jgi:hypothetical protein
MELSQTGEQFQAVAVLKAQRKEGRKKKWIVIFVVCGLMFTYMQKNISA